MEGSAGLLDATGWSDVDPDGDWKQLIENRALTAAESASLRRATHQGRPFGDARFVKTLEARLARTLAPKPMGPPTKNPHRCGRVGVPRLPNRDLRYDLTIKSRLSPLSTQLPCFGDSVGAVQREDPEVGVAEGPGPSDQRALPRRKMSYDLGIHVWYDSEIDHHRPSLFAKAAVSVPGLATGRLTVADTDPSEVVLDLQLQASDEQTIEKELRPFLGENFAYQFERTFECGLEAGTSDGTTKESRPLSVHLCGSGYGIDGYYQKRNGLLRLSFSNVRVFWIPPQLLERARTLPPGGSEQTHALRAIGVISHNIDLIHSTAEAIILGTDPTHLMVCTEWEVHPLTAHAMYHRDLTEFGRDLCRIVSMSEQGGLYLQAPEGTGKYADPRKGTLEYGYLRNTAASAELAARIETLKGKVVNASLLPEDRVKEVLMTAPGTESRQLRQSLYIAAGEGACSYLEGPFFDLATAVPDARSGYTQ